MGKVKRLELWWQLYRMSLPVRDLENFRPMDFCSTECTCMSCIHSWKEDLIISLYNFSQLFLYWRYITCTWCGNKFDILYSALQFLKNINTILWPYTWPSYWKHIWTIPTGNLQVLNVLNKHVEETYFLVPVQHATIYKFKVLLHIVGHLLRGKIASLLHSPCSQSCFFTTEYGILIVSFSFSHGYCFYFLI